MEHGILIVQFVHVKPELAVDLGIGGKSVAPDISLFKTLVPLNLRAYQDNPRP